MHQIVDDIGAPEGGGQRFGFEDVALINIDLMAPGAAAEFVGITGEATDGVTVLHEAGDESSADIAGCAEYEDSSHRLLSLSLPRGDRGLPGGLR